MTLSAKLRGGTEGDSRDAARDVHHLTEVGWRLLTNVLFVASFHEAIKGTRAERRFKLLGMRLTNAQQRTRMKERQKLR